MTETSKIDSVTLEEWNWIVVKDVVVKKKRTKESMEEIEKKRKRKKGKIKKWKDRILKGSRRRTKSKREN